jgi:hypothetical protein
MSEGALLDAIRKLAKMAGGRWMTYHTRFSRGSEPGWPDLVLLSVRQHRLIVAELKREGEQPTAAQELWLGALAAVGIEVAVWRPSDLPEIAAVLRGRRIEPGSFDVTPLTEHEARWMR